jgi:hypothetical protein
MTDREKMIEAVARAKAAEARVKALEEAGDALIHAVNNMAVGIGVHNERNPGGKVEGPVVSALFVVAALFCAVRGGEVSTTPQTASPDGRIVSSNGTPQENAQAMADYWQARAIKAEGKDSWALGDSQPPSHGV